MDVDSLSKLVAQALYDTSKVDSDVGGKIRMGRIDSNGFHETPEMDIYTDLIVDQRETQ